MPLQSLRPGFRFSPTGEVVLQCYLRDAINGQNLPSDIFTEADLYGDKEPWKLFNPNHSHPYWVFTHLKMKRDSVSVAKQTTTKKKGKGNSKAKKNREEEEEKHDRTAGGGSWKGRSVHDILSSDDGEKLGFDREYKFKLNHDDEGRGSNPNSNGNWIMHEFSIKGCDLVICEIKNLKRKRKGTERDSHDLDDDSRVSKKLDVGDRDHQLQVCAITEEQAGLVDTPLPDDDDDFLKKLDVGDRDHQLQVCPIPEEQSGLVDAPVPDDDDDFVNSLLNSEWDWNFIASDREFSSPLQQQQHIPLVF
ncbi:No apical meristem (NAM) protein [Corchorus capsularis]|uniref:No apical meristem (NAM) protein n=1 Tax=Corchorus capsularis TaxID=210143 RepID=A0A1R3JYX6_COCAP|nr:No apical meristem (NAM) protein [Corchorus capsularis]